VTVDRVAVRRGLYADSVTLMQLSRDLTRADGVQDALVAMATELNLDVLARMGFMLPAESDSANDLLIAIRAQDEEMVETALALADRLLTAPSRAQPKGGGADLPPRTVSAAVRASSPGLAFISVPGQHAFTEAMDALDSGCDVMVFSDNVAIEAEIVLKDRANERGLLVMGPDCGTAVIGGIGLGFSHTLDAGPIAVVAASGTGAQQVLCLLDAAGVGVSAAIGVGGRDLSQAVAGRSTRAALRRLADDPGTALILVVSKPPAAEVAEELQALATQLQTPVQFALLGQGETDLTAAVSKALTTLNRPVPRWPAVIGRRARIPAGAVLRGLFCGGTLCDEAMVIASASLGPVFSNTPLRPEWAMDSSLRSQHTSMIDFGDDALTRGRAHPMIDPSLRTEALQAALADPTTGVLLLDVVLGHGSHPDPVGELLPSIERADVPVVISLIGARRDPQGLDASRDRLHRAGASVFGSNAEATRYAVSLITQRESS
jgi:FdrA protein